MSDRQFKGIWIPAHIWEQLDLTAAERCLWAEIDSFTNAKSGYYKTNEQAAEELGKAVEDAGDPDDLMNGRLRKPPC